MLVVRASEYSSVQNNEITNTERCRYFPRPGRAAAETEEYQRHFFDFDNKPDKNIDSARCASMPKRDANAPKKRGNVAAEGYQMEFFGMDDGCKSVANPSVCDQLTGWKSRGVEHEDHQKEFYLRDDLEIRNRELCSRVPVAKERVIRSAVYVMRASDVSAAQHQRSINTGAISEKASAVASATAASAATVTKWTKEGVVKISYKWKAMSKKAKIRFVAILSAIVIAVAAGAITLSVVMSPANRIVRCIQNAEYDKANEIFSRSFSDGQDTEMLEKKLINLIETIKEEFLSEQTDYETSVTKLYTIDGFDLDGIWQEVEDAEQFLYRVNESMIAYRYGVELYDSGDYLNAIHELRRVIPEDPHYEN